MPLYSTHPMAETLPVHIDPRNTVARALFGEHVANIVFSIFKHRAYALTVLLANLPVSVGILGGFYAVLAPYAWLSLFLLVYVPFYLLYNLTILWALLRCP